MDLLPELSLKDKISLLTVADYWTLCGHSGIGLRPIRTSDGPAGVRGPRWDERDTALNVPAPVALAATWDPRRAELIGTLLTATIIRPARHADPLTWSSWRRRHQRRAGPAITNGKPPPNNDDHDLQLEYWALPIGNT